MIRVECGRNKLTVSGHAGAGEYGHDLVCAAVSALVLTLCECVKKSENEKKVIVRGGSAEIFCEGMEKTFDVICTGLKTIEEMHPENVKVYTPEWE